MGNPIGGHLYMNDIRPKSLKDFVGNIDAIKRVRLLIDAAKIRGEMPPHIAILGPKGRGKTLLAELIASELNAVFYIFNATAFKTPRDIRESFAYISLHEKTVIAIDEAHALNKTTTNTMLSALESKSITWNYEGQLVTEHLIYPHTVILMTTDEYRIFPPLLSRCDKIYLRPYTTDECAKITYGVFGRLGVNCTKEACIMIGRRSGGEARQAVHYARNAYDLATIKGVFKIDENLVKYLFDKILLVDKNGLQSRDIELLGIINKLGTASIGTLASMMDEPINNLKTRENFLIKANMITISSYGRELTKDGKEYVRSLGL